AGEQPVSGVDVLGGGRRTPTDADGRFAAWEMTPYDGLIVAVDSLTLDPAWAPTVQEVRLRPSPNLFTEVTIGVHHARELAGSVLSADAGRRPLGGVRVELLDGEGRVVATERTFSDGVYYLPRVRPGRYLVRVSPPMGGPQTVQVEVPSSGEEEVVVAPILVG